MMGMTATRERLLDSALRLISEKGYIGATTREIAQDAGLTELTLFRHFGSKGRLFEEVLQRYTFLPRLKELLPDLSGIPYEEALEMVGTRFIETLKERKTMVKIMHSEVNNYPDKIRAVYSRFINEVISTLAGYFSYMQRDGKIRSFPPERGAMVFLGMLFSYFEAEMIIMDHELSRRKIQRRVRDYVDIFVNGTVVRD